MKLTISWMGTLINEVVTFGVMSAIYGQSESLCAIEPWLMTFSCLNWGCWYRRPLVLTRQRYMPYSQQNNQFIVAWPPRMCESIPLDYFLWYARAGWRVGREYSASTCWYVRQLGQYDWRKKWSIAWNSLEPAKPVTCPNFLFFEFMTSPYLYNKAIFLATTLNFMHCISSWKPRV